MQRRVRLTAGLLCAAGLTAASVLSAGAASAQASGPARPSARTSAATALPVNYSFAVGFGATFASPTASPPGSNNFSCHPSAAHPYPVVLVHGTFENMDDNWQAASPLLANHGYCVFAFNYGGTSPAADVQGTGDIAASAGQLAAFVDKVLAATGAAKVDIIGHSQGGMMPRYYLKFLGGASKVHTLVGLSPSNHGTTIDGLTTLTQTLGLAGATNVVLGSACESCVQQEVGSSFLTELNSGGDTVPGVTYTVIETRYDEVVTPYTSAFLAGPDVMNITVQNQCPLDLSDHLEISYDPVALADVLNALDPAHPVQVPCTTVLPLIGPAGLVPYL
jgi:triacylglycerol esterase/lipase EstA (alpha/beta hydrolase family)